MHQLLRRAQIVILFFYFSIVVGNMNLYFIKLASDMLHWISHFIKLNEQAEKLIKLNFGMVNLNANMVNVNKKSHIIFKIIADLVIKCGLVVQKT